MFLLVANWLLKLYPLIGVAHEFIILPFLCLLTLQAEATPLFKLKSKFIVSKNEHMNSISLANDERSLITCSNDGAIKHWDLKNSKLIKESSPFGDYVHNCILSPDGNYLMGIGSIFVAFVELATLEYVSGKYPKYLPARSTIFGKDGKSIITVSTVEPFYKKPITMYDFRSPPPQKGSNTLISKHRLSMSVLEPRFSPHGLYRN
jgi:hypothetical protein